MAVTELTREEALRLHQQMWTEMQQELGDDPDAEARQIFKAKWCKEWCKETGYPNFVHSSCFLCEYSRTHGLCRNCLIDWSKADGIHVNFEGYTTCGDLFADSGRAYYLGAPISLILAIPEREAEA